MIIEKILKTIQKYRMIQPGDKVVAGVSGGVDSMVLLKILDLLRPQLHMDLLVAHLNHGLRGEEAERDAAFVLEAARSLNIPCRTGYVDVKKKSREEKLSLQEVARLLRYEFFFGVLEEEKAQKVALGHHADDQAETVLMRLLRGTGPSGLAGIPPVREGKIIRPLIEASKVEIESFARLYKVPFVADSSSQEDKYLRNRIRHFLVPELKSHYNPSLVPALTTMAEVCRDEDGFLQGLASKEWGNYCLSESSKEICLSIPALLALPPSLCRRALREALKRLSGTLLGFSFAHIHSLFHIIQESPRRHTIWLPRGLKGEVSYEELRIFKEGTPALAQEFIYNLEVPGKILVREIELEARALLRNDLEPGVWEKTATNERAYLDYRKIASPLTVRPWRPGDRFQPLGMQGTKKLKDLFIDKKIPYSQRCRIPIFLSEEKIIWVGGHQIADFAKVSTDTEEILEIELKEVI